MAARIELTEEQAQIVADAYINNWDGEQCFDRQRSAGRAAVDAALPFILPKVLLFPDEIEIEKSVPPTAERFPNEIRTFSWRDVVNIVGNVFARRIARYAAPVDPAVERISEILTRYLTDSSAERVAAEIVAAVDAARAAQKGKP